MRSYEEIEREAHKRALSNGLFIGIIIMVSAMFISGQVLIGISLGTIIGFIERSRTYKTIIENAESSSIN